MTLGERRIAADAFIQRLQALGLKPGAAIVLYAHTMPEWAWDQLAMLEACGAIQLLECVTTNAPAVEVTVGPATLGIFRIGDIIKGESDGA